MRKSETVSVLDVALDRMTREQLVVAAQLAPGYSVPALFRADADALRSAIRTYVRLGRLTAKQVTDVVVKA